MVRTVLSLVLVTNDVRQHHFHKQKIYLLRFFPLIQPLFPLRKDYFYENNIKSTCRNNSLHPGYLTSLVTSTNDNIIQTIDVYVYILSGRITTPDRLSYHTGTVGLSVLCRERL